MPRPGSAGFPSPGMDVRIVDDDGRELPVGEMGNLVLARVMRMRMLLQAVAL
jgi:propionyl-CoA synthetase